MRMVTGAFAGQTCNNYMYLNIVYYSHKERHKNAWNHDGVKMHHVKREKIAASTAVITH